MTDAELRALALAATPREWHRTVTPQTILALLDRLAAAERDAARYRWLRDPQNEEHEVWRTLVIAGVSESKFDALIDAAIDAAVAQSKHG